MMNNKKERLEDKIESILIESGESSLSDWDLANKIWDNCMTSPKSGNGVRIAHIRRAAYKSEKLDSFIDSNGSVSVCLSKNA